MAAAFAAFVFCGWVTPTLAAPKNIPHSYVTPEGAARMMAANGIEAQWHAAREICVEDGYAKGSTNYRLCVVEYKVHSLRALRARAKALTDKVARQHGLCIDRQKFEISRCKEI